MFVGFLRIVRLRVDEKLFAVAIKREVKKLRSPAGAGVAVSDPAFTLFQPFVHRFESHCRLPKEQHTTINNADQGFVNAVIHARPYKSIRYLSRSSLSEAGGNEP